MDEFWYQKTESNNSGEPKQLQIWQLLCITSFKAPLCYSPPLNHSPINSSISLIVPTALNKIVLWLSYSEIFWEIFRKASLIEIIFSISCKLWKLSRQLFYRTPSNGSFRFLLSYFFVEHDELEESSAVTNKCFWMSDGEIVADTGL